MNLSQLLDVELLKKHIDNGFVNTQRHPTLPIRILNYSQKAQFDGTLWGDGTIDYCRGLIIDDQDVVVSRCFKKFHNLQTSNLPETWEENLPQTLPTITKKYDGSLGVYWKYDEQFGVATRGSFTSPQAQWATKWIQEKCPRGFVDDLSGSATPLFEIIYPENRIVVKYDWEGLVLIGLVSIHSGYEYNWITLLKHAQYNGIRLTECIKENLEILKKKNIENEEGYVLTYRRGPASPPLKVKVKMADYLRLHKIVTGMNARSVWELLSSGTGTAGFEHTPEHFQKWLASWSEKLNREFNEIFVESRQIFANRPPPCGWTESIVNDRAYRAVFAEYLRQNVAPAFHGVLFAMLDGKDPAPIIWKQIKPRGDDATFRTEGE